MVAEVSYGSRGIMVAEVSYGSRGIMVAKVSWYHGSGGIIYMVSW